MSNDEGSSFQGYFSKSHLIKREALVTLKVISPFLAILVIIGCYHEFVLHAIEVNKAINGLIIGAASYGVILIIIRLINAQRDFYTIERFGREAMQGIYMPLLLEQPWLRRRYVRHYLGFIAQTGGTLESALQQNAIENELHALASEYEHKLELPQFTVGFMVAMGLLGTFIGLLETLTGISAMLDGFGGTGTNLDEQFMKLVGQLKTPLGGMGIAFSASMFGLVTSLMLAIMMINLRRYISRVVALARNVMHDLTELAKTNKSVVSNRVNSLSPDQITALSSHALEGEAMGAWHGGGAAAVNGGRPAAATIMDGDQSLQDMIYQVNDTSLTVASRIDSLVGKIDALIKVFESGHQLAQKQTDLLSSLPQLTESSERIYRETKNIVGKYGDQAKGMQCMIDIFNKFNEGQEQLKQAFPGLAEIGAKIVRETKVLSASQGENQRLLQMLVDAAIHNAAAQGEMARHLPQLSEENYKTFNEMKVLSTKAEEQKQLTQTMIEVMKHIAQSEAEFAKTMPSVQEVGDQIVNAIQGLFGGTAEQAKLMHGFADVGRTNAQLAKDIGDIQSGFREDIRTFFIDLDTRFARMETGVSDARQNLTHIKEMFGNFGIKLDSLGAISKDVAHQTLLLETLLKEDRNLQKRLVSMQQDFRERFQVNEIPKDESNDSQSRLIENK